MALQYINVSEIDFGRGIDARSAENQISEGFVRDLLNADVIQKNVRKRTGYESYAGNIPVRVSRMEYSTVSGQSQVKFTLDSSISLDAGSYPSPLLIYGKSSTFTSGPFTSTSDTIKYYKTYFVPYRRTLLSDLASQAAGYNIPGAEHGLNTSVFFCNIAQCTTAAGISYSKLIPNSLTINTLTSNINIGYTIPATGENVDFFAYYFKANTGTGNAYIHTWNHTGGNMAVYIPPTVHNLLTGNILYRIYQVVGTDWQEVKLDSFLLTPSGNGTAVEATMTSIEPAQYKLILCAAPQANILEGIIPEDGLTKKITLSNVTSPWIFYSLYLKNNTNQYEYIEPDSVTYDEITKELTLFLDNPSQLTYRLVYQSGIITSNVLAVSDNSAYVPGIDEFPQITIWGLDHKVIYSEPVAREGWTTHIDTYRRSGERKVIAGLGGNLFIAKDATEFDNISQKTYREQYLYPTVYPFLQSLTYSVKQKVGRLFYDTGDTTVGRSRGYITTDIGGTGWVSVTSVEYDTSNGWTKYTLSVPNMKIYNSNNVEITSIDSMISITSGLEDWLTINNMSYKRHEGTFKIKHRIKGTHSLQIWVENPDNNSTDWNDPHTGGFAGIFTDKILWSAQTSDDFNIFIPGDRLFIFEQELSQVYSSSHSSQASICGPFESTLDLAENVTVTASRKSSVIPIRTNVPIITNLYNRDVSNLVKGDMLSYAGIERHVSVVSINADRNHYIDITSDGTTATVKLTPWYAALGWRFQTLFPGNKITLVDAGNYSGVQKIDTLVSDQEFTFKTTLQESVTEATIVGKTIEIDEDLQWSDSPYDLNEFNVERRWIPIEAPEDTFNLTPPTYVRHFDTLPASNQAFIRSTMVSDNLYLTNGADEVMKFDGQNIYRAGLPAWQPGLFAVKDISLASKIVIPKPRVINYTGLTTANKNRGEIQLDANDMYAIPVGTQVLIDGDTKQYTVRGYEDKGSGGGTHVMLLDRALDTSITAAGTIKEISGYYKYYFRLNAVDANDNIIISAVTSSDDMTVTMTEDAAIRLRLVGLPTLDNYNYNRIEIEIYRTKLLTPTVPPVFYKVVTLGSKSQPAINFDRTTGYLDYIDSAADNDLTELDRASVLSGAELGIGWSDPLRAKYITTTNNRLVLGNVRDYPEFDIQIEGAANLTSSIFAGDSLLFKKNYTDTFTDTDMVNRIKFEWVNTLGTCSVTPNTNEFTITTTTNTGVSEGSWIYLTFNNTVINPDLKYSGWWQVKSRTTVGSVDTIKINLQGASVAANYPDRFAIASEKNVPVYLGPDGNLKQDNGDSGGTTAETFDATRRLALALNSVMRMTDTTLAGMSAFRPWLISRSGNDVVRAGRIIVRAPQQTNILPSVIPTFSGYSLFINSLQATSTVETIASERVYPSRILVSYQNYPELFDSPTAILDTDSLSAIDINPADGQEITGVIPFFGEAAFTAAQQAGILVVFKTNSIYLVDINQKVSGSNLVVQRLETQGLGCTAPYSISVTKNGIMFANNSGIYCLRRDQTIEYIGKFMERNWGNRVDKDALSIAQGHHYGVGRMYKLSVPIVGTANETTGYIEPSEVYVYNHTQEDEENHLGAWSRYDNHTAIGWANLASDAFWASTKGQVYILRTTGTETDFRDANQPIVFRLDTRPNDYGNSGIRKILDKVVVSYRSGTATAENHLFFSVDLEQEYSATTPFRVAGTAENLTGFDDSVQKDVITLRHSLDRRKGVYFSIRIENSNLDQNIEPAGLDYRIGGLDSKGIKSASKT